MTNMNSALNTAKSTASEVSSSMPDLSSSSIRMPGQEALFSMLRKVGLGAAVVGSSIGLSGFAEKRAEGGIVVGSIPDANYTAQGEAYSGPYTGPGLSPSGGALFLSIDYLFPGYGNVTRNTSATWINEQYAITNAHNFSDLMQYSPSMRIGTGPNFLTNPGTVRAVESILFHPSYPGSGAGGSGLDLAIIKFSVPITGGTEMVFADSTPGVGTRVNTAGYGVTGTTSGGAIYPQDGYIRGGTIETSGIPATNIGDPSIYNSLFFRDSASVFLDYRPFSGDSGSPVLNLNNELLGINTGGGLSASDRFAYYLDLTPQDRKQWIFDNTQITAVPEPSSGLLLLGAAGIAAAWRALGRRQEKSAETDTESA